MLIINVRLHGPKLRSKVHEFTKTLELTTPVPLNPDNEQRLLYRRDLLRLCVNISTTPDLPMISV